MEFDIFKRITKHDRMKSLEKTVINNKKLTHEQTSKLVKKLSSPIKDNSILDKYATAEKNNNLNKKLTIKESDILYQRLVSWNCKVSEKIKQQQIKKQIEKEQEEKSLVKKNKLKNVDSANVVQRLCEDTKKRAINFENTRKEKSREEAEMVLLIRYIV